MTEARVRSLAMIIGIALAIGCAIMGQYLGVAAGIWWRSMRGRGRWFLVRRYLNSAEINFRPC